MECIGKGNAGAEPDVFLGLIRYCGSTGDGPVHREAHDGMETPDAQAETLRKNWRLTHAPFDEASYTRDLNTLRRPLDYTRCRMFDESDMERSDSEVRVV
ncbi:MULTISPECIES: hypothetical protein [unclassified Bradyrhizobium]|uniref:hypothetical protein n=1 Tax=unclassified Bradyrhizobium TaxID=2631580 RepID=UPI001CD37445|nr:MULTISPECIES: hypothetical protein [unclassified Bradyrhizobium]MCA1438491.1 hypothetical protein [Bradyrhizobium sp. BRP20]MCA1473294.1 hypothetical protein [Bradyrhizobium sp. IC3195]MCA1502164.1 hypothetical protein [Bradyrhizobium sp. NBAIM14]MCA1552481.1 hypothetical protein [Bradyrhizobium sp. BRP19]